MSDIFGASGSLDRDALGGPRCKFLKRDAESFGGGPGHFGFDKTRCNSVSCNTELAEFKGVRFGNPLNSAFAAE